MPVLHLGVIDVPYTEGGITTGEVAQILEDEYHVIEIFFEQKKDQIERILTASVESALQAVLMGSPTRDPFGNAGQDIETLFREFLLTSEMEGLGYPGVPTAAALKGVNHRFAHPYAKANPRRPSFIDTGTYENSFKAWVD
jgi:hypothetical protein